jgi:hypothetical protein
MIYVAWPISGANAKSRSTLFQSHQKAGIGARQGAADLGEVAEIGQPSAAAEVVDLTRLETGPVGQLQLRDTGLMETAVQASGKRLPITGSLGSTAYCQIKNIECYSRDRSARFVSLTPVSR